MKGCNYIKRMIDEADKADLLSFEINEHISHCGDCERFANERTALRGLLASDRRGSAPMNFYALLKARLGEVKARNAFSWFSAPGIMRLGAATAGVVIILFAAQYTGLFSDKQKPASVEQAAVTAPLTPGQRVDPQPTITSPLSVDTVASGPKHYYSQRARVAVERDRTATRALCEIGRAHV